MKREEAFSILQEKYDYCKSFYDLAAHPEEDYAEMAKYLKALQVALSALRPVSREMVKKAEWIWSTGDVYSCSSCGKKTHVDECMENPIYNFCPFCMAPMTDEAVEMVLERMEELKDATD